MRKNNIWPVLLPLMLLAAGMVAAGLIISAELVWGMGAALFMFLIALLPGLTMRRRHLSRMEKGQPLARWRYSVSEAARIAEELLAQGAKKHRGITILISVCFAIIAIIFIDVIHAGNPDIPLWQLLLLLILAVLPWIVLLIYRAYFGRLVLQEPCETVIGRDFLLLANTRPVFNERADLKTTFAQMVRDEKGDLYLEAIYRSTGRMRYGQKITFKDTVKIPVPEGREEEARILADVICGKKKQEAEH